MVLANKPFFDLNFAIVQVQVSDLFWESSGKTKKTRSQLSSA